MQVSTKKLKVSAAPVACGTRFLGPRGPDAGAGPVRAARRPPPEFWLTMFSPSFPLNISWLHFDASFHPGSVESALLNAPDCRVLRWGCRFAFLCYLFLVSSSGLFVLILTKERQIYRFKKKKTEKTHPKGLGARDQPRRWPSPSWLWPDARAPAAVSSVSCFLSDFSPHFWSMCSCCFFFVDQS